MSTAEPLPSMMRSPPRREYSALWVSTGATASHTPDIASATDRGFAGPGRSHGLNGLECLHSFFLPKALPALCRPIALGCLHRLGLVRGALAAQRQPYAHSQAYQQRRR